MKPGFLAPRGAIDKKPPHGAPCNRCGMCCMAVLCPLGQRIFKRERGPCPALVMKDGQSSCGVVDDPMRWSIAVTIRSGVKAAREAAKFLIGSATGCDARFNGEKPNVDFYALLRRWDRDHRSEVRSARKTWGI